MEVVKNCTVDEQVFLVCNVWIYVIVMDLVLSYSVCKELVWSTHEALMEEIPY